MNWGPGQRQFHDAVIGYTNGERSFIEPTNPPENLFGPGGRYRPHEVIGPLGQPGQLVYDFSKPTTDKPTTGVPSDKPAADEPGESPQISCQAWAVNEPDPAEWTKDLFSCPCTRGQALQDLTFLQDTSDLSPTLKKLRSQRWGGSSGHIFQSVLSNRFGSGKLCVYDPEGPLLAGYNERYFFGHSQEKHIGL